MPAVFVGHGNPMNAIEHTRFAEAWADLGRSLPRPAAVLAVSAHWYVASTAVTAMERPRTIHDFAGFPDALFRVQYPAPGDPGLARRVHDLLAPVAVDLDQAGWGIDHGTWSVLVHAYPDADVPVVQLSIDATRSFDEHMALAAALAPLREEGVLVLGSGNVVHNLRRVDWSRAEGGEAWAEEFDAEARTVMTERPGDAAQLAGDPRFPLAAPTPDHFIPLLYIAALAAASGDPVTPFATGCVMGSLSMTSYRVG